jgi:hypothetical protein
MIEDTYILVRSSYRNETLSRARLERTKESFAMAASAQQAPAQLIVAVSASDPFLDERVSVFEECSESCRVVYADMTPVGNRDVVSFVQDWGLPERRLLTLRCDDDDVIASDYLRWTVSRAEQVLHYPWILDWPLGYVMYAGKLHRFKNPYNQFIGLLSRDGTSVYRHTHKGWRGRAGRSIVCHARGWIWFRHKHAAGKKWRPRWTRHSGGVPTRTRWAVSLP